jgi:hypothetical protein
MSVVKLLVNLACLFAIICIYIGVICFIFFTVKALSLTSYHEQKQVCSTSDMWMYVLMFLVCFHPFSLLDLNDKQKNVIYDTVINFINLGFLIWGLIELFGNSCSYKLENTLLYLMTQTIVSLLSIWCVCMIIYLSLIVFLFL